MCHSFVFPQLGSRRSYDGNSSFGRVCSAEWMLLPSAGVGAVEGKRSREDWNLGPFTPPRPVHASSARSRLLGAANGLCRSYSFVKHTDI